MLEKPAGEACWRSLLGCWGNAGEACWDAGEACWDAGEACWDAVAVDYGQLCRMAKQEASYDRAHMTKGTAFKIHSEHT